MTAAGGTLARRLRLGDAVVIGLGLWSVPGCSLRSHRRQAAGSGRPRGEAAFRPRSRRPHGNPQAISPELEKRIIRLRKNLTKKGLDARA
jgi:hypothetical protein